MSRPTAVAAPPSDERDRLRAVLWQLLFLRCRQEMGWRVPEYVKREPRADLYRYRGPHVYNKRGDCEVHTAP